MWLQAAKTLMQSHGSPREAQTPISQRWGPLLASGGPERRIAVQKVLDTWYKGRWVVQER